MALYHAAPPTAAPPSLRYEIRRSGREAYLARSPARPDFGPASLADAWAFLEWRATEDLLSSPAGGVVFLHAGAVQVHGRLALVLGPAGSGKSTLVAHLLARGHRALGDDVLRFTPEDGRFSAVGRSLKLDANTLSGLPLVEQRCATAALGTFLALDCYYVSPAVIRRTWEALADRPWALVVLDAGSRDGPGRLERSSEGEAAVRLAQNVLGAAPTDEAAAGQVTVRLLESLREAVAYRALGSDPAAVARAVEREAVR